MFEGAHCALDFLFVFSTQEKNASVGKRAFGDGSVSGIGSSPTAALISFHRAAQCVDIDHSCPNLTHPGLLRRCFHCTSQGRDVLKVCDLFLPWTFSSMQAYVVSHHKSVAQEICAHRKKRN